MIYGLKADGVIIRKDEQTHHSTATLKLGVIDV